MDKPKLELEFVEHRDLQWRVFWRGATHITTPMIHWLYQNVGSTDVHFQTFAYSVSFRDEHDAVLFLMRF